MTKKPFLIHKPPRSSDRLLFNGLFAGRRGAHLHAEQESDRADSADQNFVNNHDDRERSNAQQGVFDYNREFPAADEVSDDHYHRLMENVERENRRVGVD